MSVFTRKPEPTTTSPKAKPKPRWLTNPGHDKVQRSKKHEERLAKMLGGRRLPRSGGKKWSPRWEKGGGTDNGDVTTPNFHLEHKRTDAASLSVKREWLDKVAYGARQRAKDPGVVITFETPTRLTSTPVEWILLPMSVFERLRSIAERQK